MHLDHVVLRDALCDADDEGHLRLNRLEDRRRRARRGHVQNSRVRARLLLCFGDRCKDRLPEENSMLRCGDKGCATCGRNGCLGGEIKYLPEVRGASLLGVDAADHLRAVCDGLLAVEGARLPSEPLADDLRVLEDCWRWRLRLWHTRQSAKRLEGGGREI